MNALIFSKDRACQLDLLLRSLKKFWPSIRPRVIYKVTDRKYQEGYDILQQLVYSRDVEFEREELDFRWHVQHAIDKEDPYTTFLVDDDVIKVPVEPPLDLLRENDQVACLSLRLYPGICYSYTRRMPIEPPKDFTGGLFEWQALKGDWAYPMSVDGSIFRTQDLIPYIFGMDYKAPNTMEGRWAQMPIQRPKMWCGSESAVLNIPWNRVQTENGNHNAGVDPTMLNDAYTSGLRIDFKSLIGLRNISCHQEMPLRWAKRGEQL